MCDGEVRCAAWAIAHFHEFADFYEAEALGEETVEGAGHGVDAGDVDVVDEDDGTGAGLVEDAAAGEGGAFGAPVFGVDAPLDGGVAEFVHDPLLLASGDGTVGWAVHARGDAEIDEGGVGAFEFRADGVVAEAAEFGMGPCVVGEFVAVGDDAAHDAWVGDGAGADGEEGGADIARLEHVEEARGIGGVWAVIEGHGDERAVYGDAVVADAGAWGETAGGVVGGLIEGWAGDACRGGGALRFDIAGAGGEEGEGGGEGEEKLHGGAGGGGPTRRGEMMGRAGLLHETGEDGEGHGDIAEEEDEGEAFAGGFDEGAGFRGGEAEGLEDAGEAVAEVAEEEGHGDDVEGGGWEPAEAVDDHVVDVFGAIGEPVAFAGGVAVAVADAGGVVEDVVDDEGEDGEAAEDHDAAGAGGLAGGIDGVLAAAGGVVGAGELDGGDDVDAGEGEEADAGDPEEGAEVVEFFGVGVEGVGACVDEEVAQHVDHEESDEEEA